MDVDCNLILRAYLQGKSFWLDSEGLLFYTILTKAIKYCNISTTDVIFLLNKVFERKRSIKVMIIFQFLSETKLCFK